MTSHERASWWQALLRRNDGAETHALNQRLDALDRRLETLERLLRQQQPVPADTQLEAMREALAALEKQVARAGREQFKANTLAETQASQLTSALDTLRTALPRHDTEIASLRERQQSELATARLDLIRALLPSLDGIDEALRSGRQVLAQTAALPPAESVPAARTGWLQSLFGSAPPVVPAGSNDPPLRQSLDAWLTGLTFVQRRLLELLAANDVTPISAEGQPFDPRYHIALAAAPPDGQHMPGTISQEVRRGYLVGERVLRHAEVIVVGEL